MSQLHRYTCATSAPRIQYACIMRRQSVRGTEQLDGQVIIYSLRMQLVAYDPIILFSVSHYNGHFHIDDVLLWTEQYMISTVKTNRVHEKFKNESAGGASAQWYTFGFLHKVVHLFLFGLFRVGRTTIIQSVIHVP